MNRSCFSSFCPGIGAGIAGGKQARSCALGAPVAGAALLLVEFTQCRAELWKNAGFVRVICTESWWILDFARGCV